MHWLDRRAELRSLHEGAEVAWAVRLLTPSQYICSYVILHSDKDYRSNRLSRVEKYTHQMEVKNLLSDFVLSLKVACVAKMVGLKCLSFH